MLSTEQVPPNEVRDILASGGGAISLDGSINLSKLSKHQNDKIKKLEERILKDEDFIKLQDKIMHGQPNSSIALLPINNDEKGKNDGTDNIVLW